jgi:glycosyltransferase involved in cell wall biosynthesis
MIYLIFRKANNHSHSIEKVFNTIFLQIGQIARVEKVEALTRSASLSGVFLNIMQLRKLKGAVFHITGDLHYGVFAFPRAKTILTIHDCVFLENTSGIKRWLLKKIWLEWPVKYAAIITTISEKSKQEIIENTGCRSNKIIVIPNPVADSVIPGGTDFNGYHPRILFIGTKPNKNLERALQALKGIKCELIIIGKLSDEQVISINQASIIYSNYFDLSEEEIGNQYQKADIVLFPSLYEGFGLPVLESQKAGKPVITSNITPLNIVAGNGACLVDPYDANSIRMGLDKVMKDVVYRDNLVQKGFQNVKQYSPEKISGMYLEQYRKIMNYEKN